MENYTIKDKEIERISELARTLLVLNNYKWIKSISEEIGIKIIPLKGIDLLQNLYIQKLDRHINDIDILCYNENDCKKLVERLCEQDYHIEFPFAMNPSALTIKQKVSLISSCPTKVNIDIHIAFITKKFFSRTIGSFNADALQRCTNGYMELIDKWLFLAQHAAFHMFAETKWTRDLSLLYQTFTHSEKIDLLKRANLYGFRRVIIATIYQINKNDRKNLNNELKRMHLLPSERRFLTFITFFDRPFSRNIFDRFISAYWEFPFITLRYKRLISWLRLIFPSKGMLTNIYRINKPINQTFFYPLNILISGFTSFLFCLTYYSITICKKRKLY